MKEILIKEAGSDSFEYISKYIDVDNVDTLVVSTSSAFNIDKQYQESFKNIVNLKPINDIRRINKFFESVNAKLEDGGVFICNVETYTLRKQRILKKYPKGINWGMYTFDFFVKRVSPKVWGLKKVYFFTTAGRNRVLSKAETLGRIYSCGFKVVNETRINGRLWVVVKKIKEPSFDTDPTYGPLISLKRHGKNGKLIKVYKARTMHAYSEYLQEYVYEQNDLQEGGKFKNDFRITTVGKIFRKTWLDELPMILNLLKRDLKLVGVRPLSQQYMSLYPEDFQELRKNYRPGLVPPFYADLPKDLEEIIASEKRYLEAFDKHPIRTDWVYFWKAFNNIVFKKARSN
ncbi:MAG: sugar transferase [Bacteroidetes bacterium 4572_112]|nr:MAG: sugar transferase [Bacteroidetes bacterium 4572_112]